MAAQGARAQPAAGSAAYAAEFRASQVTARRERDGISSGNVPFTPASGNDEGDQLTREQNVDRFANGIGSPLAQLHTNTPPPEEAEGSDEAANNDEHFERSGVSEEQNAAFDSYTALQNQTEDNDNARIKLQSFLRGLREQGRHDEYEQAMKELRKFLEKRKTDLIAKGASTIDEGELIEILDTIGVAVSAYQLVVTIFKDSISKELLDRMPVQPLEFEKSAGDVASAAGTIMQLLKWTIMVFVLIPFVIAFQITAVYAFCDWFEPCSLLLNNVLGS